ncbi:MAG: hypothetical protein IAG13_31325 [Deltaproteobacteria bacterium]|nr:hypothetical protein [Nannocystaceae bacterium]
MLGCVGMITGCNGDDGGDDDGALPECIEFDATACAPLYQPTYANVFAQTLQPDCATGGGACHANPDALGAAEHGLFFTEASQTHALLLDDLGDDTFVRPGDASCGVMTVRLRTEDDLLRMPTGSMLLDTELCSVLQWIDAGANP